MKTNDIFEKLMNVSCLSKNWIDYLNEKTFDLEDKILFYIFYNDECCPSDLISHFKIKKTNLAIICKKLFEENKIITKKDTIDGRAIKYCIAPNYKKQVEKKLESINNKIGKEKELDLINLSNKLDEIIKLFRKEI